MMNHAVAKTLLALILSGLALLMGWKYVSPAPATTDVMAQSASATTPASAASSPDITANQTREAKDNHATASSMQTAMSTAVTTPEVMSAKTEQAVSFIASQAFTSAEQLDAALMDADGAVMSQTLEHFFMHPQFQDIVQKIASMPTTDASQERQAQLQQQLYDSLGTDIQNETFACAGKLCTLSITTSRPVEPQKIDTLASFDSNFMFRNVTTNSHGETVTKILFIATKDPSQLTVR